MDNIKVSVIVPIYKVEQYLDRCVQSILKQNIQNMEILLVDDGSPDRCGELCDYYAQRYEKVRVIHKENGGLSDARNAGIKVARGEYIACIDSDDYIQGEMLSDLCELLDSTHADIAVSGINTVVNDMIVNIEKYEFAIYESKDALCAMLYDRKFWVASCNKIYRKELFEKLLYPKGRLYEDYYLIPRLMDYADKVVVSDKIYYHYCIRDDSIMGISNERLSADIIYNTIENMDFFKKRRKNYKREQYEKITSGLVNHLYFCTRQVLLEEDMSKYWEYVNKYMIAVRKILPIAMMNKYLSTKVKMMLLLSACSFSSAQKFIKKHVQT